MISLRMNPINAPTLPGIDFRFNILNQTAQVLFRIFGESIVLSLDVSDKGLVNERGEITNLTEAYKRLAAAARIAAKVRPCGMPS